MTMVWPNGKKNAQTKSNGTEWNENFFGKKVDQIMNEEEISNVYCKNNNTEAVVGVVILKLQMEQQKNQSNLQFFEVKKKKSIHDCHFHRLMVIICVGFCSQIYIFKCLSQNVD